MRRSSPQPLPCLLLLLHLLLIGGTCPLAAVRAADDAPPVVVLVVDYGDGVQKRFTQLSWKSEMTVLDALNQAARHDRGIRFEYRGEGPTAFLTRIDELENEGRGRNWTYRVNGKLADRSFAIWELKAKDTILWKFGRQR